MVLSSVVFFNSLLFLNLILAPRLFISTFCFVCPLYLNKFHYHCSACVKISNVEMPSLKWHMKIHRIHELITCYELISLLWVLWRYGISIHQCIIIWFALLRYIGLFYPLQCCIVEAHRDGLLWYNKVSIYAILFWSSINVKHSLIYLLLNELASAFKNK